MFCVMEAFTFLVRVLPAAALRSLILLVTISLPAHASVPVQVDLRHLVEKMESAYAEVDDYQTKVHVEARSTDGTYHTETFLYSFEKPDRIRIDFESPHSGLVLVYPDKKLASVKAKSITKRMKEKAFAASVNRETIMECELLGIPLPEFADPALKAMQCIAGELGL